MNKNNVELILKGIKEGDQIGGPYELAEIFPKSLEFNNRFYKEKFK
tara:strand:- start:720 stop:857 length:138 start_codon:yes stop_codon:yes gene_type:complete